VNVVTNPTNVSGQATAGFTTGATAGLDTITATDVANLPNQVLVFSETATVGNASTLTIISGIGQVASTGTTLAPIVALVTDGTNPVPNVPVVFSIDATSTATGNFSNVSATTDANGHAQATLTFGKISGTVVVDVSAAGQNASTNEFAVSGNAYQILAVAGSGQSATVGTSIANPVVAQVVDVNGNPVAGATVTFGTTFGGSLNFVGPTTTDAAGKIAATWQLGPGSGQQQASASAFDQAGNPLVGSPAFFTANATGGGATAIVPISGDGQTGTVAQALQQPLIVQVQDKFGNPVQGAPVQFQATAPVGNLGSFVVQGGPNQNPITLNSDANGFVRAVFQLGPATGQNTVTITAAGSAPFTSPPVTAINYLETGVSGVAAFINKSPGAPLPPSGDLQPNLVAGTVAPNPIVVRVTDSTGNPVAGVPVTFAVTQGGGSVSNPAATTDVNGLAQTAFTTGPKVGQNTFTASSPGVSGSPVLFTENTGPGTAYQLVLTSGNGQFAAAGTSIANPLVVSVLDQDGNLVTNNAVGVTFTVAQGNGSFPNPAPMPPSTTLVVSTGTTGMASITSWTLGAVAGPNVVTASVANLVGSPVQFNATGTVGTPARVIAFSGNGQAATVGTTLPQPCVAQVLDAANNPIAGVTVNFTAVDPLNNGENANLSALSAVTNSQGFAQTTLTLGITAGSNTVSASAVGGTNPGVNFFEVGVAGSGNLLLQVVTTEAQDKVSQLTVNSAPPLPLEVTLLDSHGNRIPGAVITWAVTAGGGSLSQTTSTTDANGDATTVLTLGPRIGLNTVTASAAGANSVTFHETSTLAAPATQLVITSGNGQTGTVGQNLANNLVVTVYDQFSNPVPGFSGVNIAPSTSLSFIAPAPTSDANGQIAFRAKLGNTIGTYNYTASIAALSTVSVTFAEMANADVAGARISVLSGNNQTGVAGNQLAQSFVALVQDGFQNPVTGIPVTWTPSFGSLLPNLAASPYVLNTNAQGLVSVTLVMPNTIPATNPFATTATIGAAGPGQVATFSATDQPAAPATITVVPASNNQTFPVTTPLDGVTVVNAVTTVLPTVTVLDQFGNPVGGVTVNFAPLSGGASVSPSNNVTAANGQTSTVITLGTSVGVDTVQASVAGIAPATFQENVTNGAAANISIYSGNNQATTPGTPLAQQLVALVTDRFGNPVLGGANPTVSWAIAPGSASSVAGAPITTTGTDATFGHAAISYTPGTKAGTDVVTATVGAQTVFFTVTINHGQATTLVEISGGDTTGGQQNGLVATSLAQPFIVQAQDSSASHNPVPGVVVSFAVTKGNGVVSQANVITDAQGFAQTTLTLGTGVGPDADQVTPQATAGGSTFSTAHPFSANAFNGPAAHMFVNAGNNQTGTVGTNKDLANNNLVLMSVLVTDAFGNPVVNTNPLLPAAQVTFSVTGGNGSFGGSPSSGTITTDGSGIATAPTYTLGNTPGTNAIAVTPVTVSAYPGVVFTQTGVAGTPQFLVYVSGDSQPNLITGSTTPQPLVAQVTDSLGNPLSGVPIQFTISATNGTSTLVNASSQSDANGFAKTFVLLSNLDATTTVTMTAGASGTIPMTGSVAPAFTEVASSGNPFQLVLSGGNGQTKPVGQTLAQNIVATVLDANGHPFRGQNVVFTAQNGGQLFDPAILPAGAFTLNPVTLTTNVNGVVQTQWKLGPTAGAQTVTATASFAGTQLNGSPLTYTATATAGPPTQIIPVSGDRQTGTEGTALAQPIVVQVLDAGNNPVANQNVVFTAFDSTPTAFGHGVAFQVQGQPNQTSAYTLPTNAQGFAQVTLVLGTQATAAAHTYTVQVTPPASAPTFANADPTPTFTETAIPGAASSIVATQGQNQTPVAGGGTGSATAGQAAPLQLVATVTDAGGNLVPGVPVTFQVTAGGGTVSPVTVSTDGAGNATVTLYTGPRAGVTNTVSASAPGVTGTASFTIATVSGNAYQIVLTAGNGQTATVGGPLPNLLVASVLDQIGNPVAGQAVTFSIAAGGGTLLAPFADPVSVGGSTVTDAGLTGFPAGTAFIVQFASQPGVNYGVSANTGTQLTLNSPYSGPPVGGTTKLFISTAAQSVTFPSDSNGTATVAYDVGPNTGANSVTATAVNLVGSPVVFSETGKVGTQAAITVYSGNGQAGTVGTILPQLFVARVTDGSGNPVPNVTVSFALDATAGANPSPAGVVQTASVLTDQNGLAASAFKLSTVTGTNTVDASVGLVATPATFTATGFAANGSAIAFTAQPSPSAAAPASEVVASQVGPYTVQVKDSNHNVVPGATVFFSVSQGSGTVSPTSVQTDSNGMATTTLTVGTIAGQSIVVTAATANAGSTDAFPVTAVSGPAARLVEISGNGQSGTAGVSNFVLVTEVVDAFGNPVQDTGATGNVKYTVTSGGGTIAGNPSSTQFSGANGQSQVTLLLGALVGTNTVTAQVIDSSGNPINTIAPVTFTETGNAGTPASIVAISGSPQTGAAGSALPAPLVVQVTDTNTNPVPGKPVQFAFRSGGGAGAGVFVPTNSSVPFIINTDAQGFAQVSIGLPTSLTGLSAANNVLVDATAKGGALKTTGEPGTPSFSETTVPGPAATITVFNGNNQSGTVNTNISTNGANTTLQVQVLDAFHNPVADNTVVNFAVTSGGGAVLTPTALTSGGIAQTDLTLGTIAGLNTVQASLTGLTPVTFDETGVAGGPANIAIVSGNNQTGTAKQGAAAATPLANPLVVIVTDSFGNPVPPQAAAFITWTSVSGSNGTNQLLATTNTVSSPLGDSSLVYAPGVSPTGTDVIKAAIAGASVQFTVAVNPGAPHAIVSVTNIASTINGTVNTPLTWLVEVVDASGNPVPNALVNFAVAQSNGTVNPSNPVTNGQGLAQTTFTLGTVAAASAGAITDKATASATTVAGAPLTNSPLTLNASAAAGPASKIFIANGNNQSAPVGTTLAPASFSALTVQVTDAFGNPVGASATPFVMFAITSGGGSFGAGASPITVNTNASGQASTHDVAIGDFTLGNTAGLNTVTASITGASVTFNETATAGGANATPYTITLAPLPNGGNGNNQIGAAGSTLRPFVALVQDKFGNNVVGASVMFQTTSGTFIPNTASPTFTGTTDANGLAQAALTLPTFPLPVGGTVTVNASVNPIALQGLNPNAVFSATVNPSAPAQLVFISQSATSVQVAGTVTLNAQVEDAFGNPVDNVPYTFSVASGGGSVVPTGTKTALTGGVDGCAQAILTTGLRVGTNVVNVSAAGVPNTVSFQVTTQPGGAASIFVVSGNGQNGAAGSQLQNPLIGQVVDANGNPVGAGTVVTFSSTVNGFAEGTFTGSSSTDANGRVFPLFTFGNTSGNYLVSMTVGSSTALFNETATAGSGFHVFEINTTPFAGVTATVTKGQPTATLSAAVANAIPNGATIQFSSQPGVTYVVLSGSGTTTLTLTTNYTGSNSTTATVTQTSFDPATSTALAGQGVGDGQTGTVRTTLPSPIQVQVQDGNGNGVSGVLVTFAVTTGNATVSPQQVMTDANGNAQTVVKLGTTAGTIKLNATAQGLNTLTFTETSQPTSSSNYKLTLTAGNNQTAVAGSTLPIELQAQVTDNLGNPVPNQLVTFTISSGGGQFATTPTATTTFVTGTTNAKGFVSPDNAGGSSNPVAFVLGKTAGTNTVTVTSLDTGGQPLINSPLTFSEIGVPGPATTIVIAGTPPTGGGNNQTVIDGASLPQAMVALVTDANNNPVPGITVTWAIQNEPGGVSGGKGTFPPGNNKGSSTQIFTTATSVTGPDGFAQMGFTTDPSPRGSGTAGNIYQITASAFDTTGKQLTNSPVLFNEIGDTPIITVASGGQPADYSNFSPNGESNSPPNRPTSPTATTVLMTVKDASGLNAGDTVTDGGSAGGVINAIFSPTQSANGSGGSGFAGAATVQLKNVAGAWAAAGTFVDGGFSTTYTNGTTLTDQTQVVSSTLTPTTFLVVGSASGNAMVGVPVNFSIFYDPIPASGLPGDDENQQSPPHGDDVGTLGGFGSRVGPVNIATDNTGHVSVTATLGTVSGDATNGNQGLNYRIHAVANPSEFSSSAIPGGTGSSYADAWETAFPDVAMAVKFDPSSNQQNQGDQPSGSEVNNNFNGTNTLQPIAAVLDRFGNTVSFGPNALTQTTVNIQLTDTLKNAPPANNGATFVTKADNHNFTTPKVAAAPAEFFPGVLNFNSGLAKCTDLVTEKASVDLTSLNTMQYELHATSALSRALTGTVTVPTAGTPTIVTGAGTKFQSELVPNQTIVFNVDAPAQNYVVQSIQSDTQFTLASPYTGTNGGASSAVTLVALADDFSAPFYVVPGPASQLVFGTKSNVTMNDGSGGATDVQVSTGALDPTDTTAGAAVPNTSSGPNVNTFPPATVLGPIVTVLDQFGNVVNFGPHSLGTTLQATGAGNGVTMALSNGSGVNAFDTPNPNPQTSTLLPQPVLAGTNNGTLNAQGIGNNQSVFTVTGTSTTSVAGTVEFGGSADVNNTSTGLFVNKASPVVGGVPTPYNLTASGPNPLGGTITSPSSAGFVVQPSPVNFLGFAPGFGGLEPDSNQMAGSTLTASAGAMFPTVHANDRFGNPVNFGTNNTYSVTLTLLDNGTAVANTAGNPGSGFASASATYTSVPLDSNGHVVFNGLVIDAANDAANHPNPQVAGAYRLKPTGSSGSPNTFNSTTFTVNPLGANAIAFNAGAPYGANGNFGSNTAPSSQGNVKTPTPAVGTVATGLYPNATDLAFSAVVTDKFGNFVADNTSVFFNSPDPVNAVGPSPGPGGTFAASGFGSGATITGGGVGQQAHVEVPTTQGVATATGFTLANKANAPGAFFTVSADMTNNPATPLAGLSGPSPSNNANYEVTAIPGAPNAGQSSVTANPTAINADGSASAPGNTSTITITVRDQFGNPVPGATVTLAGSHAGDQLTQPVGVTSAAGVITGTLSPAASGTNDLTNRVIQATVNGSTVITQTATVIFQPGPAAALNFVAATVVNTDAGSPINGATGVQVEIRDSAGNLVSSGSNDVSVNVGLAAAPSAFFSGVTPEPSIDGVATFPGMVVHLAANGTEQLTASAVLAANPTATANSALFSITPAANDHLAFVQQPSFSLTNIDFTTLQLNKIADGSSGTVVAAANQLQLCNTATDTDPTGQGRTAYTKTQLPDVKFQTSFVVQVTTPFGPGGAGEADGFSFVLQNTAPTADGGQDGTFAYSGTPNSVAIYFDYWQGRTGSANLTNVGIGTNGIIQPPIGNMGAIDFHNAHPCLVTISYDAATQHLDMTVQDTITSQSYVMPTQTINIPGTIGSQIAFAGFGGSTGGGFSRQTVTNWNYNAFNTLVAGNAFTPAIAVALEDPFSNVISFGPHVDNPAVKVDLSSAGEALNPGLPQQTTVAGLATFGAIDPTTAGSALTLLAQDDLGVVTAATSNTYNVLAAAAKKLVITQGPVAPTNPAPAGAFQLNGTATSVPGGFQLTPATSGSAGSVFTTSKFDIRGFHTDFSFTILPGAGPPLQNGFTFCVQGQAPTFLGNGGVDLGYGTGGTGPNSLAVSFDVFFQGGSNSHTGGYTNGNSPDTSGTGTSTLPAVDFRNGDTFNVDIVYDGATLIVTTTDTGTGQAVQQAYNPVDLPTLLGGATTAFIGFTGATGSTGGSAVQTVTNWTFGNDTFSSNVAMQPPIIVKVEDQFGNVEVTDQNVPTLAITAGTSQTGGAPTIVTPVGQPTGSNGVWTFTGETIALASKTPYTVTAAGTGADAGLTVANTVPINVIPGPASTIVLDPAVNQTAGAPFDIMVTAFDAAGNQATGYQGTLHFATTDTGNPNGTGIVPVDYAFTIGTATYDNGQHKFPLGATLFTVNAAPGTNVGTQTLTATDTGNPSLTSNFVVSLVAGAPAQNLAGPGNPPATTLAASPSTQRCIAGQTITFTFTAVDAWGNPCAGATANFASTGTGNGLSTTSGTTGASAGTDLGIATFTMSSTKAEPKTVSATNTSPNFTVSSAVTFTPGPPDPTQSSITPTPANGTNLVADGTAGNGANIAVLLADFFGNGIAGANVTLNVGGTFNGFTNPLTDAGGGNYTGVLTSTKAETKSLQFTMNSDPAGDASLGPLPSPALSVTFVPGPAAPGHCSVTATGPTVADGSSLCTVTVTAKDQFNNPVADLTNVSVTVGGSGNSVSSPVVGPTNGGVFQFTFSSTSTDTNTPKAIQATIGPPPTGGVVVSTSATFVPGPVDPNKSTIVASPTAINADNTSPGMSTFTVTALDANSNPIQGATVSLADSVSANDRLVQPSGTTTINGVSNNGTLAPAPLGTNNLNPRSISATVTVGATSTPLANPAIVTFQPGPPAQLSFTNPATGTPPDFTTDAGHQINGAGGVLVYVLDAAGNLVTGANQQSESITLSAAPNPFSASGTNPQSSIASTGIATFTGFSIIQAGNGNYTLTATAAALANPTTTSQPFSINPAKYDHLSFLNAFFGAVDLSSLTLNGGASLTGETLTLCDGAGGEARSAFSPTKQTITTFSSAFTMTLGNFGGIGPADGLTFTIENAPAGANALGVGGGGLAYQGINSSVAVEFDYFAQPSSVTLVQTDALGNQTTVLGPLDTRPSGVNFQGTGSGGTFNVQITYDGTNLSGTVADLNGNVFAFGPVAINIPAVVGANTAFVGFTGGDGGGSSSQNITVNSNIVAGQQFAPGPQVAVEDQFNNIVNFGPHSANVGQGGTQPVVTIDISATNGTTPCTLVGTQTLTTGATTGIASFGGLSPHTAGTFHFAAHEDIAADGGTALVTNPGPVSSTDFTVVGGAPDQGHTSVGAVPNNNVTADGSTISVITVTVSDLFGNPVPDGVPVTLSSTGSNNTFSPSASGTTSGGTFSANMTSTTAETKTITATIGLGASQFTETCTVTFVPGPPSPATSTLTFTPAGPQTADGVTAYTFTVTVEDAQGNLVGSVPVVMSSSGSNNSFAPGNGNTDNTPGPTFGTFASNMTSTTAETKTVTAKVNGGPPGGFNLTQSVTFIAGPPVQANSSMSASPSTNVTADGVTPSTITVTLRDANNNLCGGINVSFSSTGSNNTFSPATGSTDNVSTDATFGMLSSNFTTITAEMKTVSAAVGAGPIFTLTTPVTFVAGTPDAAHSFISAVPNTNVVADGSTKSVITVTIKDVNGNLVGNVPVVMSATGSNNSFAPGSGNTGTSGPGLGVFASNLTTTTAETKTVTATVNGGPPTGFVLTTPVTFVAGSPAQLVFIQQPTGPTPAGAEFRPPISVQIKDVNGNNCTTATNPVTMNFQTAPPGSTFGGTNPVNAQNGVATFTDLTLSKTGINIKLKATATFFPGGVISTAFTIGAEVAADGLGHTSTGSMNFGQKAANDGNATPANNTLNLPSATALDTLNHRLFVADSANNRILVFQLSAVNDLSSGHNAGAVIGQLLGTQTFATNTADTTGTAEGFQNPTGLAFDSASQTLFVADTGNNRVVIFSAPPASLSATTYPAATVVLGQAGFAPPGPANAAGGGAAGLNGPTALAFDGTNLYVCDTGNNRVLVYAGSAFGTGQAASNVLGQVDFATVTPGTDQGGGIDSYMTAPSGVAVDTVNSRLFVVDGGNNRVLVFNLTGLPVQNAQATHVLGQANFTTGTPGATAANTLATPFGADYDSSTDFLYVADGGNNRVLIFNTTTVIDNMPAVGVVGQVNMVSSTQQTTQSGVAEVTGVTIDSTNKRLWVTDGGVSAASNNRILLYNNP